MHRKARFIEKSRLQNWGAVFGEVWLTPSEVMAVAIVKYLLRKSEVKCAHTLAEQTSLRSSFTVRSTTSRAARRT